MSGEYSPSEKDTQFTAPKNESKLEDRSGKDELDKDKVYGELFAKLDALKNLRDFTNSDLKLVSDLLKDRGQLFGYDEREKELQGRINDVFAELYKRGDELREKEDEKYKRKEERTTEDGVESDNYLDLISRLTEEVSKGGFAILIKH